MTEKQARFVEEYLIDLNGAQAATRAGYSKKSARKIACELLGTDEIQKAIDQAKAERAERTRVTQDKVLERWWTMANVNVNELIEFRRTCCRYCHGKDHLYQVTKRELAKALQKIDAAREAGEEVDDFEHGGTGWDPRREPHPHCPECFGDGRGKVHVKDTRKLSPEAQLLYAGVKETRDGIELKMHDPMDALTNVAKHIGMFIERREVKDVDEFSNLSDDELDAEIEAAEAEGGEAT